MPRKYRTIICSKSDFIELQRLAADSRDQRLSLRCQMVLQCLEGKRIKDIASLFHERPNTVILWKNRFASEGISGLYNRPRGKPVSIYDRPSLQNRILETIRGTPPDGASRWTGKLLAENLQVPAHVVWRLLKKMGLSLSAPAVSHGQDIKQLLEVPLTLAFYTEDQSMSDNTHNKMDLEIVARITGDDGMVIEKTVRLDKAIPNISDFDLSTRDGFLHDFDALEGSVIRARNQIGDQISAAFMEEAAKKNKKKP